MQTDESMLKTGTEPQVGLTGTVHTSPPDISVKDVARLMTTRGIGSVVIVGDDHIPIGIVTDRDLVLRVTAPGLDAATLPIGGVMSSPLVTITKDQDIGAAIGTMVRHGIRRLPIVDEKGYLASILTLDDLLRLNLASTPELTQIIREQGHALPPEPGAEARSLPRPSVPVAADASGVFGTSLPFRPGVSPDTSGAVPGSSSAEPSSRQVAAVAKRTVVVPMVKRRRQRTFVEGIRHWIYVNKLLVIVMIGLAFAVSAMSILVNLAGNAFDTYQQGHYEPKDEERRVYMKEKQRIQGNQRPGTEQ
jgi:CBS domain-containing protein